MRKPETKSQKESRLNYLFSDCYSEEQAVENFIYLTSKQRKQRTTERHIRNCHNNRMLGSLLRKMDSIAFECAD